MDSECEIVNTFVGPQVAFHNSTVVPFCVTFMIVKVSLSLA